MKTIKDTYINNIEDSLDKDNFTPITDLSLDEIINIKNRFIVNNYNLNNTYIYNNGVPFEIILGNRFALTVRK